MEQSHINKIKEASQKSLYDFLILHGIHPRKETKNRCWYISPFRSESTPSMVLCKSKNKYKDFGDRNQPKYNDIIDFAQQYLGVSKLKAAEIILDEKQPIKKHIPKPVDDTPYFHIYETKDIESSYLIDYLEERKINIDVARKYCKELHVRWPKSKHPSQLFKLIGWPSKKGGWEVRNTFTKLTLTPSYYSGIDGSEEILLFEGFMNYLSFLTHHNVTEVDKTVIVLNGIGNWLYCEERLIGCPVLYNMLDNDQTGDDLTDDLLALGAKIKDLRYTFEGYNDYNDALKDNFKLTNEIKRKRTETRRLLLGC